MLCVLQGFALAALVVAAATAGQRYKPFEYQQVHMGLPVRILLHASDDERAERAARAAFDRIAALDRMMSDYRPDSELRALETDTRWTPVSAELLDILITSVAIARQTRGAFDPTVGPLVALWREARKARRMPDRAALDAARARVGWQYLQIDRGRGAVRLLKPGMRLDLGGVAKGYILQQALRTLQSHDVTRALVESGGDIVVGSAPPGARGWQLEAAGADAAFRRRAAALTNAALATSGTTEQFVEIDGVRYSHIVDPRTGIGITHEAVASVIARDAAIADAIATSLVVLGQDDAPLIVKRFPQVLISLKQ